MLLDALLAAPHLSWERRRQIAVALEHPSCWPHDPTLAAAARAHGFSPPAGPAVGVGLLVAVAPEQGRATLLALRSTLRPNPLAVPQGPVMRGALRRAEALCPATVPWLVPGAGFVSAGEWEAVRVFASGGGESLGADGSSFGLAMLLAVASAHLDEPIPADLLALATVDDAGRTGVVHHLDHKLALVRGAALGVRRVLVTAAQRDEALRHAGALEVVAVDDAVEALGVTFAGLSARLRDRWSSPHEAAEAAEAAEAVLKLALIPPRDRTIRWQAVAEAAQTLTEALHHDPDAQERARFARAIAARHAGDTGPLPWPSARLLEGLTTSRRLRCIAQGVQAAADAGDLEALARTRSAQDLVADPTSPAREALELQGAIGRAFATLRDYPAARACLEAAVAGWWALDAEEHASYALGELVRVCGVLGDASGLDRALRRVRDYTRAHPRETVSLAYLALAEGRALVQVGRPAEALAVLSPLGDQVLPPHVRAAMLRWQANAHAALGDRTSAAALRATAATFADVAGARSLVALDAALEAPTDDPTLEAALAALIAERPQGIHGLLGPGPPHERAARIAREYPY